MTKLGSPHIVAHGGQTPVRMPHNYLVGHPVAISRGADPSKIIAAVTRGRRLWDSIR